MATKKKAAKRQVKKKAVKVRRTAAKRKPAKKKRPTKHGSQKKLSKRKKVASPKPPLPGKLVAQVTHFFPKVNAAVLKMKDVLRIGDQIVIKGHTTDLKQAIQSLQVDHAPVSEAKRGDEIGLRVTSRVREGDQVYRL